jgi:hypothetical protein
MWAIQPFEGGGIIKIFSLRLSGEFGFMMKIANIQNDPKRQLAVDAGGEILERYGMPRGRYRRSLMSGRLRDLRGNLIPDITDKPGAEQRKHRDREFTKAVHEGKANIRIEDVPQADNTVLRKLYMQIGGDNGDHQG